MARILRERGSLMRAQLQSDEIICEQCCEPFPETRIVITADGLPVCRTCWRLLRRSDSRREEQRRGGSA